MLGTVAATVALFVMIPKGFFPQQDTGNILGIAETSEDISPTGIAAMQGDVIDLVFKDPAVASVGAYIGAGARPRPRTRGVFS